MYKYKEEEKERKKKKKRKQFLYPSKYQKNRFSDEW